MIAGTSWSKVKIDFGKGLHHCQIMAAFVVSYQD